MPHKIAGIKRRISSNYLVVSGLGLVFCFGATTVFAQQNQPGDVSVTPTQQDQQYPQEQGPPDQGMQQQGPADQGMQQAPPYQGTQQQGPPYQAMQQQGPPYQGMQQQAPPYWEVPQTLTLPAGTTIRVRVNEWLSSERNVPGDGFSAVLDQPIIVGGFVVARRGQAETGHVSVAQKAGHAGGSSKLGVELTQLTLVDGQQLPIQTKLFQTSGGTSHGPDVAAIGATAGVGAAAGAVAAGPPGAVIGAGAGMAAGVIGVLISRGRPTFIFPETVLSFTLQAPVTISTDRTQAAFQPVAQGDYDSRPPYDQQVAGPPPPGGPGAAGYPPPPAPYYGYPYAYGSPAYGYPYPYGYYPYPVLGFGFYGRYGYGYGPRFGGGFRGGFRR